MIATHHRHRVPSQSRQRRYAEVIFIAIGGVAGWLLFFFWWLVVAEMTLWAELGPILLRGGVVLALLIAGTLLWIEHNITLAARGSRGYASRYRSVLPEADHLDRPLRLPEPADLRSWQLIMVELEGDEKVFRQGEPGSG